ncbi:MAG: DsbA family protein [Nocardioidaceae bacterium]
MAKSNKRRDEERRSAAAARVAQLQRAQQAAERRRRALIVSAVAVAVIVAAVGGFLIYQASKGTTKTVAASGVGGSTTNYGFVVGDAAASATMVVYEDFQCPACKLFEDTNGKTVQQYITDGKLKVEYRPIAFLDRQSSTEYSTRSLNAAACVTDSTDTRTFKTFHDLLYANQPVEGSAGLTDDQLVTYAKQAGAASPAVATCIKDQTFKDWAGTATETASKEGVAATPTVQLDGSDVAGSTWGKADAFKAALDEAVAKG